MGILLITGFLSLFLYSGGQSQGAYGVIESQGNAGRRLDLSSDQEVSVSGPLGETVVEVKDGRIRVKRSPCPHQVCVKMGFKGTDGDVVACVPNRVVVRVTGDKDTNSIDGVTR